MAKQLFELKYIFGLKIKELRQKKGITYQELNQCTGLSISYLSEIESGKKYPKGDKIALLAEALSVSYDELVSLKVPDKLQPIVNLIESEFFREFPLEEFGVNPQKLIEVVAQDPTKTNAFIKTIMQIAKGYELKKEHLFYAALRSYQELQQNYLEDIEDEVENLNLEFTELKDIPFQPEVLEEILLKIGVRTDYQKISKFKSLSNIRSLYHPKNRILFVNSGLSKGQKNFLLGREIAFQWLKLKKRPVSTPPYGEHGFDMVLNNYLASYFSAALIMPKRTVIPDIKDFAAADKWDSNEFLKFLSRYDATPEMIMQRLTNILPTYFKLRNLFFLRMLKKGGKYFMTKELHLNNIHNPHSNELNEHYCRRWLAVDIINQLETSGERILSKAQLSKYYDSKNEYFCLSIAFPNVSNDQEFISVTIGFLNDRTLKKRIKFIDDPQVSRKEVNITCERCSVKNCAERAEEPLISNQQSEENIILKEIEEILASND